ncbi:AAA family ATPase [Actinomadura parmotrematis]|uniref:AAA family ATPase n=1 Tax=Actinomadura parmotrematis TaxID=2864039 RepID=A0ABS7FYA3_9ACTN|nr:AAA family ATPase [Actinomadura parmotrematis]MBW8484950.1 AAA family ATPase [Actinomadura parmotrematis]
MPLQVLLGVADPALATTLRGQFRELPDIEVVATESTSEHVAGTVATSPGLDVVLVHEGLGPLPALDLVRDLVSRYPQLAVVLIADGADADTFAAAMAAGARGAVTGDPTLAELQSRVEQAAEWSRAMRRHFDAGEPAANNGRLATLVTLCGAKGGVGTTTAAVHLAIAVAKAGRRVCLVDMDLQNGDLPAFLDVQHRHSIADLAAAAGGELAGAVVAEALFVHPEGPHLLLAPARGEDAEEISSRAVRQIMSVLRSRYDVVIVDGGTHLADAGAVAVELADTVVVVATPDVPALRSARRLTQMFSRLGIRKEEDVSVLLTKHDRRNEIQPDLARRMVGSPLLGVTVPAAFRALEEAANLGSPAAVKNADFRKSVARLALDLGVARAPDEAGRGLGGKRARDGGAVSFEFAALFPFIVLLMLLVWQIVLVGLTSTYASHAANEGARAAAVLGYDTPKARQEVRARAVARLHGKWKDAGHLRFAVTGDYAVVTIDTPVLLPGLRSTWGITARARIVREGEDGR